MTGLVLGLLTFLGFFILVVRLPSFILKLLLFNPLLTDISAAILTYVLITSVSSSVIALVASAVLGLLTTASLHLAKNHLSNKYKQKETYAN